MRILFSLLLLPFIALSSKPSICLNMIVRNEEHVIERALNSVKQNIDYWVIVDTGSTDNTRSIIKNYLKDIPGELIEKPWVNFAHNRTEALNYAKSKADYILFLDADDWLHYEKGFIFPELIHDSYYIKWKHNNELSYLKPQLVKADLPWKWEGVLHEYLSCDQKHSQVTINKVINIYGGDGARTKDPNKFSNDIKILKKAIENDSRNSRYIFYLAESYRANKEYEKALETYLKRIEMGGWEEEIFWSYFQVSQLKHYLNYPLEEVIDSYNKAHRFRPHRAEPIFFLMDIYNNNQNYALSYECYKGWESIGHEQEKDILFKLDWVYSFGIKFQLSLSSYYLGKKHEFLSISKELLKQKNIPVYLSDQIKKNLKFSEDITDFEEENILITIFVKNKEHLLDIYLNYLENIKYNKRNISLYFKSFASIDNTKLILDSWIKKNRSNYRTIFLDEATIKETKFQSLKYSIQYFVNIAKMFNCKYAFLTDCNTFTTPSILKHLIGKKQAIISPYLESLVFNNKNNSYFFSDNPINKNTCLINLEYFDGLSLSNENLTPSVCNDDNFGYLFNLPNEISLNNEQKLWLTFGEKKVRARFDFIKVSNFINKKAKEYKKNGLYKKSLALYEKIYNESLSKEDKFYSFLESIELNKLINNKNKNIQLYEKALDIFPDEFLIFYYLTKHYREIEDYEKSYKFARKGVQALKTSYYSNKFLWIKDCAMLWEFSLAAHYLGHFQKAFDSTKKILNNLNLSEDNKNQLKKNLSYYKAGIILSSYANNKWGDSFWQNIKKSSSIDEFKIKKPKLHICSVASDKNIYLDQLTNSAKYFNNQVTILGLNEKFSFSKRLKTYYQYLCELPEDDIVLFIDAYDILILGNEEKIIEKFLSLKLNYCFSAEKGCHPFPHLAKYYPKSKSDFKYLNAGAYIGYVKFLRKIFEEIIPIPDEIDDQGLLTMFFLYDKEKLFLDHNANLFLSLYKVDANQIEINEANKSVTYSKNKTKPLIIHGNGTGKNLYQHIYNRLFLKDYYLSND